MSAGSWRCSLLSLEDDVVLTFERGGFTWTVDAGDEIGRYLFSEGSYEGEELDAVLSWLRVNRPARSFGTFVDLGANVGTTTSQWRELAGKSLQSSQFRQPLNGWLRTSRPTAFPIGRCPEGNLNQ
jgi:hypothetical protein